MNLLLNKTNILKLLKRNAKVEEINYAPFAILTGQQLDGFLRHMLYDSEPLSKIVREKTGNGNFATHDWGNEIYKRKKLKEIDVQSAALESMMVHLSGWGGIETLKMLNWGEHTFFREAGYEAKYIKVKPLYERNHMSRNIDGNISESEGIIQATYISPEGSFMINQNQVNKELFEVYVSEDISQELYQKLVRSLEFTLNLKANSITSEKKEETTKIDTREEISKRLISI